MRARYFAAAALALLPSLAFAAETTNYSYDAKGRLIQVAHVGGRNDGVVTAYTFDAADNRTSVVSSGVGASGSSPSNTTSSVVIVPLNGFTLIPFLPAP